MAKKRARQDESSPRWIGPAILAAIILYAAVVGALLLHQLQESPFSRHPVTDEEAYITQAGGILAGTYPGDKVFYQSPLYPYLLALKFRNSRYHRWYTERVRNSVPLDQIEGNRGIKDL